MVFKTAITNYYNLLFDASFYYNRKYSCEYYLKNITGIYSTTLQRGKQENFKSFEMRINVRQGDSLSSPL